ncbi:MAG: hypothetical protein KC766_41275 [Myxococcales bacterium]|nr:hypothetical protein [Myxococcales bacterium]
MGMGIWPVFNPKVDFTPDLDGKSLLDNCELLDELALKLGVSPFTSFADMRDVPEGFDGDPDELADLLGPWEDWFDIDDGLKVMATLSDALRNPEHATLFQEPDFVRDEVNEVVRCLNRAHGTKRKFRLELLQ